MWWWRRKDGASLGSAGPTSRVNSYLQDMRPTIPLQSHGCGAAQHQSNTSAVSEEEEEEGLFKADAVNEEDPATALPRCRSPVPPC